MMSRLVHTVGLTQNRHSCYYVVIFTKDLTNSNSYSGNLTIILLSLWLSHPKLRLYWFMKLNEIQNAGVLHT